MLSRLASTLEKKRKIKMAARMRWSDWRLDLLSVTTMAMSSFWTPADAYSVWLFHHDGADVERLADTFQEWLERAEPDELGDDHEDEEQD